MVSPIDVPIPRLVGAYGLLIPAIAVFLWLRIPHLGRLAVAVIRMTLQLLFVGLYLQVVFQTNAPWLTGLWVIAMILVADLSILRASGLRLRRLALPVAVSLLAGTSIPMLVFVGLLLARPNVLDAQYAIPIAGMILGNCLQADIIGIRGFFTTLRAERKPFELTLAQGAQLGEAVRPYVQRAIRDALAPTIASIATIGLVALPGMMTGAMLGGVAPIEAIKYQIAIMLAILCGTTITVFTALRFSRRTGFTPYGTLDETVFGSTEGVASRMIERIARRWRGRHRAAG